MCVCTDESADQVEFLKSVAGGEGGEIEEEKHAVTEAQWAKLIETTDPKVVCVVCGCVGGGFVYAWVCACVGACLWVCARAD